MATLGNLYDEHVDYYVQINFNGFKTLVDAVGGITVESEKAFRTSEGGFYINQGTNQLMVRWRFPTCGRENLLQMGIIPEDVIRCRQLRH